MNERIKELATQAGLQNTLGCFWQSGDHDLERFAKLVRDEERQGCAEHYLEIMRDAVAREREACAVLCEEQDEYGCGQYAKAIRARGHK